MLNSAVMLTTKTPQYFGGELSLPAGLIEDIHSETAYVSATVEHESQLSHLFGRATSKALQRIAWQEDALDVASTVTTAMCETLQTTGTNRTPLGRVLALHAARFVWQRQGIHEFYDEPDDAVTTSAQRSAARIAQQLPAFHRACGLLLRASAAALQTAARRDGSEWARDERLVV